MLLAMKFLHSTGITHRDIKPSNILITHKCTVKLCDFGFARSIKTKDQEKLKAKPLSALCYTRWYRPPELLLKMEAYDQKADMWSVGCVISELMSKSINPTVKAKENILFKGTSALDLD